MTDSYDFKFLLKRTILFGSVACTAGCFELPSEFSSVSGKLSHENPILKQLLTETAFEAGDGNNHAGQLALALTEELTTALQGANLSAEIVENVVANAKKEIKARADSLVIETGLTLSQTSDNEVTQLLFAGLVKGALSSFANDEIKGLTPEQKLLINKTIITTAYNSANSRTESFDAEATKNFQKEIVETAVSSLLENVPADDPILASSVSDIAAESVKGSQKLKGAADDRLGLGKETMKSLMKSLATHTENVGEAGSSMALDIVDSTIQSAVSSIAESELASEASEAVSEFCGAAIEGLSDLSEESESLKVSITKTTVKATMASISKAGVDSASLGGAAKKLTEKAMTALGKVSTSKETKKLSSAAVISEVIQGFDGKVEDTGELNNSIGDIIEVGISSIDSLSDDSNDSIDIVESLVENALTATSKIEAISSSDQNVRKEMMSKVVGSAVKSLANTKIADDSKAITKAIKSTSKAATKSLSSTVKDAEEFKQFSSAIVESMVPAAKESLSKDSSSDLQDLTASILTGTIEAMVVLKEENKIDDTTFSESSKSTTASAIETISKNVSQEELTSFSETLDEKVAESLAESSIDTSAIEAIKEDLSTAAETELEKISALAQPYPPIPVGGDSAIRLTWKQAEGIDYSLYWSTSQGSAMQGQRIPNVSSPYVHKGLDNKASYYYQLIASADGVDSQPSSEASATPQEYFGYSLTSLGTSTKRHIVVDPYGAYIAMFQNGSDIDYYHSVYGYVWIYGGSIAGAGIKFSIASGLSMQHDSIFISYAPYNSSEVKVLQAKIDASGTLNVGTPITVFAAKSVNNREIVRYEEPTLTLDRAGNLWVGAFVHEGESYQVQVKKSTESADKSVAKIESFGASQAVGGARFGADSLSMIPYGEGILVASGDGSTTRAHIFDGASWSEIGNEKQFEAKWINDGFGNGSVQDFAFYKGELYAGGWFKSASGNPRAQFIAKWDGSKWNPVGKGLDMSVHSLVVFQGELYVAGHPQFWDGFKTTQPIKKWDGAQWKSVGVHFNESIYRLKVHNDKLYALGYFSDLGGNPDIDRVASFDGSQWNQVIGAGFEQSVEDIGFIGNDIYISGWFTNAFNNPDLKYMIKWDGTSFHPVSSSFTDAVRRMIQIDGGLLLVGYFQDIDGVANTKNIAKFDGSSFSSVTTLTGSNWIESATYYQNELILSGGFADLDLDADGQQDYIIKVKSDGTIVDPGFKMQGSANTLKVLDNKLYASGYFNSAFDDPKAGKFFSWDGKNYEAFGGKSNRHVQRMFNVGGKVYLTGNLIDTHTMLWRTDIVIFENGNITPLGQRFEGYVNDLREFKGNLYASGNFYNWESTQTEYYMIRYDSNLKKWVPVPEINGYTNQMAQDSNYLYIPGSFTDPSTTTNYYLAKFDGSNVSQTSTTPLPNSPWQVLRHNSRLIAIGHFNNLGGSSEIAHIAQLSTAGEWSRLGSGFGDGHINGAVIIGDSLYVGVYQWEDIQTTDANGNTQTVHTHWTDFLSLDLSVATADWQKLSTIESGSISKLLNIGGEILASGHFNDLDGDGQNDFLAYYRNGTWNTVSQVPFASWVQDVTVSNGKLAAIFESGLWVEETVFAPGNGSTQVLPGAKDDFYLLSRSLIHKDQLFSYQSGKISKQTIVGLPADSQISYSNQRNTVSFTFNKDGELQTQANILDSSSDKSTFGNSEASQFLCAPVLMASDQICLWESILEDGTYQLNGKAL